MLKTKTKVITSSVGALSATLVFLSIYLPSNTSAEACTTSPCNTTFQVNVKESLTVSVTPDYTENTGDPGNFLRNKVSLSVATNSTSGFAASMYPSNYSTTNAPLTNSANSTYTIPTWSAGTTYQCADATCAAFPANNWGYSLNDGSHTGTYNPMTGTSSAPTQILVGSAGTGSGSQDVYFGAKADSNQAAGTYTGTVIISVVTGTVTPTTPSDPVTPSSDAVIDDSGHSATYVAAPAGNTTGGATVYTTTSTSGGLTTTTTQVSDGDNTASYSSPLGETYRNSGSNNISETNIETNSSAASAIAITAGALAAAGAVSLLIAGKRNKDDEDETE